MTALDTYQDVFHPPLRIRPPQQRQRDRLTIGQINQMNDAGIRSGLDPAWVGDDRSPAQRFLDLVDLPRNTSANILFGETPNIEQVAGGVGAGAVIGGILGGIVEGIGGGLATGGAGIIPGAIHGAGLGAAAGAAASAALFGTEAVARPFILSDQQRQSIISNSARGTLGQPRIFFSDALEKMGVESKVARAVLGFTGDVLLDPLTYMGGSGNVVRWSNGAGRIAVSKGASKSIDDVAAYVALHGVLPTDPALTPFVAPFRNSIKVGDQVIDVSLSGSALRDNLLEAAKATGAIPTGQKELQARIAQILQKDLIESQSLQVIKPELAEKVAASRDFFRRYASASDVNLSIPMGGFIANKLRRPLMGRTLDLPVGRLGASANFKRALGDSESEFLTSQAAKNAEKLTGLMSERAQAFGNAELTIPESAAAVVPDELTGFVRKTPGNLSIPLINTSRGQRETLRRAGWRLTLPESHDLRRLDAIQTAIADLDVSNHAERYAAAQSDLARLETLHAEALADVERSAVAGQKSEALGGVASKAANDRMKELERQLNESRLHARSLEQPPRYPELDGFDDQIRALRRGSASTAQRGPTATLKAIDRMPVVGKGRLDLMDRLEHSKAASRSEIEQAEAMLSADKFNHARILQQHGGIPARAGEFLDEQRILLHQAQEGVLESKQAVLEAAAHGGEGTIHVPVPEMSSRLQSIADTVVEHEYRIGVSGKGLEGAVSSTGQLNKVDVTFQNSLDRLTWEATRSIDQANAVQASLKREASEYLERTYGVNRGQVSAMGRGLRQDVKQFIEQGREGVTAGASAGAKAGGRALVMPASRRAAYRSAMSISAELLVGKTGGQMFSDLTGSAKQFLKRLDRQSAKIEQQMAARNASEALVRDIGDRLAQNEMLANSSKSAAEQALEITNQQIKQVEDSTFYSLVQNTIAAEDRIRNLLGLGRRGQFPEITKMRHAYNAVAPERMAQIMREYRDDMTKVLETIKDADSREISIALETKIAAMSEAASKGTVRGFPVHPITGEPLDELLKAAAELRKTERGAEILNHPAVGEFAQKYLDYFQKELSIQQALGVLPDFTPKFPYFHVTPTKEAMQAVRDIEKTIGVRRKAGQALFLTDALPFTYRKSTYRVFYGDGKQYIYMGELNTIKPGDTGHPFEAWRQDYLTHHPEKMRPGDLFDRGMAGGMADGERFIPEPFVTSAMQLNIDRSRFLRGVSQHIFGPIFEEDFATRLSARALHGEYAQAFARFREAMLPIAKPLTQEEASFMPKGLGGGVLGQDGLEYRQLNAGLIRDSKMRFPIDDDMYSLYWPKSFADAIEDVAKRMKTDPWEKLAKPLDTITSLWKKSTLFHPSWMMINMVGGAFNSFAVAATNPARWMKHARKLGGLILETHGLKQFTKTSDALPIEWAGQRYTRGELKELFVTNGVTNAGRTLVEVLNGIRVGGPQAEGLAMLAQKGNMVKKLYQGWFKANAASDDLWRVITLTERRLEGDSMEAALDMMVKAHFDFSDLTNAEQKFGRRVFPFFSWLRNNIPLQFKMALEKPWLAASFPKIKNALEEQFDAEQSIPEELRPRWMKDNIAVQIGKRPEAKFLLLSILTPIQELIEIGQATLGTEGITEALSYLTSASNPMIKAPFEITAGRELFTKREIGDPDTGKESLYSYLAQQFRPFREFVSWDRSLKKSDAGIPELIRRLTIGGKLQQTSDEKLASRLAFDSGETSRLLRRQIKKANDEGDQDEANRLSIRLIAQYRRLWNSGLFESVPAQLRARFVREHSRTPLRQM